MQTPYFVISEEKLKENVSLFKSALKDIWPNSRIAYSIKTNSLPWILKYMKCEDIFAEAVSYEEYELAKLCGFDDSEIVFNGPIKLISEIEEALAKGAIINIDSKKEVDYIKTKKNRVYKNLGLRINVDTKVFKEEDIGYEEDGFRFGFSEENGKLKEVFDILSEEQKKHIGLHFHCNSVTRSLDVYEAIAKYAAKIIKKYALEPSYIDIGGGYFGGIENKPTPTDYFSIIKRELSSVVDINKTTLIIEPGSALVGSVIDLYTSVLDIKDTLHSRIVTTDGSRIHIDPLWKKTRYMYSITQKKEMPLIENQLICGYTCMDHDRLMKISNQPELNIGDKIVYHRVGAYSVTFGGPFIKYFPEVYVDNKGVLKKVRKRMSVKEYFEIEYLMED